MFLKLILFLEDLDENIRVELINVVFCYQLLLPENHVFPAEAGTKYQALYNLKKNTGDRFITKSCKQAFFSENLRANFNQVHNLFTDIFLAGGWMGDGGILSKSCSKIHGKTSATE